MQQNVQQTSRKLNMQKWVNYWLKVPMKRKFFRHNLKHTIPKFWVPTIKIVDFTNAQSWAIYLQKWSGDWNRIYCVVTSVCVFRFVYTLPVRRNSEVNKISSDSESNFFTNLSIISDEDIMEEDRKDVEGSLTQELTSLIDVTWRFDRAIQMSFLKVK